MAARLFDAYKHWVTDNGAQLALVERIVSTSMWLLPHRFSKSEICAEACHSLLGLVRLWHESIANQAAHKPPLTWSMALEAIQQIEVLFEMRAVHMATLGTCNKYTPLTALEFVKLFVRLFVLYSSRTRVTVVKEDESATDGRDVHKVLQAFQSLSDTKAAILNEAWFSASEKCGSAHSRASSSYSSVCNEALPAAIDGQNREDDSAIELLQNDISNDAKLWWNRMEQIDSSTADPMTQPQENNNNTYERHYTAGRTMMLIGELLYILRPVISVLALRKCGTDAWTPWLTSLGIDITSHALISKGAETMKYAGVSWSERSSLQDQLLNYLTMLRNFDWTPIEEKEMRRRKMMFLMYLMRSPLFEEFTKPGMQKAHQALSYIPAMGTLLGKALELLYGVQRYHVYTSGTW